MPIAFGGAFQPIQTARASAVLEAAGAFDPAPIAMPCPYMDAVLFYLSYTRGAAGGDVQFRIDISPYALVTAGVENWFRATVFSGAAAISGADSLSNLQRNTTEYGSIGAAIENFVYGPVNLSKTAQRVRIVAAESGALGTPGTLHGVAVLGFVEETQ